MLFRYKKGLTVEESEEQFNKDIPAIFIISVAIIIIILITICVG